MGHIEKDLSTWIGEAIRDSYLITFIITSYTQAKYHTRNLPFGLGKTTLAFWLNYLLNGEDWDKVFQTTVYNPYDLAVLLKPGRQRLFAVTWDDVQATAPAAQSVPRAIRELANFISTERPEVACLFLTAPNINMISAPLRKLVNFEVIVSERGFYEVHKITYYKNFRKPLRDNMHFDYVEEVARDKPFRPLPSDVQQRYDGWRVREKMKLYPSMLKKVKTYTELRLWSEGEPVEVPVLDSHIVKKGRSGYFIPVPAELGEQLHMKNIEVAIKHTSKQTEV